MPTFITFMVLTHTGSFHSAAINKSEKSGKLQHTHTHTQPLGHTVRTSATVAVIICRPIRRSVTDVSSSIPLITP